MHTYLVECANILSQQSWLSQQWQILNMYKPKSEWDGHMCTCLHKPYLCICLHGNTHGCNECTCKLFTCTWAMKAYDKLAWMGMDAMSVRTINFQVQESEWAHILLQSFRVFAYEYTYRIFTCAMSVPTIYYRQQKSYGMSKTKHVRTCMLCVMMYVYFQCVQKHGIYVYSMTMYVCVSPKSNQACVQDSAYKNVVCTCMSCVWDMYVYFQCVQEQCTSMYVCYTKNDIVAISGKRLEA